MPNLISFRPALLLSYTGFMSSAIQATFLPVGLHSTRLGGSEGPGSAHLYTGCFHKSYSNLILVSRILEIWTEALFEGKQSW